MCLKKNKKPMYCIKCGTKQEEGEKFCPKCGTPFIVEDNFISESESEINLRQEANKDFKVRFKEGLYVAFSLIVPLLGLIFYFIKRKNDKKLAKSILICAIIGVVFNAVVYYNNSSNEFVDNDSYVESDCNISDNIDIENTENSLWKNYIGKWVYNIVLQPDEYTTVAGYGGSVYLTINENGTAHIKLTSADMGHERVVIDSTGEIEMDGNILMVHLDGGSPKFVLKNNSVYTVEGERMKRDY